MSPSPRVLIIDPDHDRLGVLEKALIGAGLANVTGVSRGSFALTMLERDRPDLIVSRAEVPDIDGWELCAIIRSDPSMQGVLFLLLAGPDDVPDGAIEGGPDRMLVGEFTPTTIVAEAQSLLTQAAETAPVPAIARTTSGPHGLRGSLTVMELPDLAQAIALGAKTGSLLLCFEVGDGRIVFERGRVVHAEFGLLTGESAFAALVTTAHRERKGAFAFDALERLVPGLPRTIDREVKQLLLSVAADIDEGRVASAATTPGEASPGRE